MTYLNKVLYRKYLGDVRQARLAMALPAAHCIFTGLDFNARTRSASFWRGMNLIQQLRARG